MVRTWLQLGPGVNWPWSKFGRVNLLPCASPEIRQSPTSNYIMRNLNEIVYKIMRFSYTIDVRLPSLSVIMSRSTWTCPTGGLIVSGSLVGGATRQSVSKSLHRVLYMANMPFRCDIAISTEASEDQCLTRLFWGWSIYEGTQRLKLCNKDVTIAHKECVDKARSKFRF